MRKGLSTSLREARGTRASEASTQEVPAPGSEQRSHTRRQCSKLTKTSLPIIHNPSHPSSHPALTSSKPTTYRTPTKGSNSMADRSFAPVDVSDDILDRFRKLPVATTWAAVANVAGVPLPFMEGVRNFTPGTRLAARARTLRFLPPRPDLDAETKRGEDSPRRRSRSRSHGQAVGSRSR